MGIALIMTACILSVPVITYISIYWYLYSKTLEPSCFGFTEEDMTTVNEPFRS